MNVQRALVAAVFAVAVAGSGGATSLLGDPDGGGEIHAVNLADDPDAGGQIHRANLRQIVLHPNPAAPPIIRD